MEQTRRLLRVALVSLLVLGCVAGLWIAFNWGNLAALFGEQKPPTLIVDSPSKPPAPRRELKSFSSDPAPPP